MKSDSLQIINTELVKKMVVMDADEIWQLVEPRLKTADPEQRHESIIFNIVGKQSFEKIRDVYFRLYEHHRESTVYPLIEEICFEGERVPLDYFARCGYLDSGASCNAKTSLELIPFDNEDEDDWFDMNRFDILTGRDVERIVQAMEKNLAALTINTPDDIPKIRSIMHRCYLSQAHNAAYIYDVS